MDDILNTESHHTKTWGGNANGKSQKSEPLPEAAFAADDPSAPDVCGVLPHDHRKSGYSYRGVILVPAQENGQTRYCGKIRGEDVCFTVSGKGTVTFQYGEKTYEPFTVKEDRTAEPYGHESNPNVVGLEVREGEKILFRGGLLVGNGAYYWYY